MRPHGSILDWLKFPKGSEEKMKAIQRLITVICLSAVLICMAANIKAKADAIEASEVIAANVAGADLTSIAYAYTNLTTNQKLIADYLMGAYNYAYMCARGFSFNIDQTETNMKAQLGAIGNRVWQYMTTEYAWRSRFNELFRQYASSIIVYASKISSSFENWISDILSGTRNVYIEYSEDAFDAWTEFYNDPSGDGIAHFGETVSDWNSGTQYDFLLSDYQWQVAPNGTRYEDIYNNFILNNSPVIFTNLGPYNRPKQICISLKDINLPNSIFLQRRSDGKFLQFRYGYDNITASQTTYLNYCALGLKVTNTGTSIDTQTTGFRVYIRGSIYQLDSAMNFADAIQYIFYFSPVVCYVNGFNDPVVNGDGFYGFYPFVNHVYLVDDLTNLSNPEEIYNIEDFNITVPGIADYILTPNKKMLIPGYAPLNDPFADLWDVSIDIDNNQATEDDFNTQIVNNTVINNYTIDASDKINVPVDWFDNPLSDQLANDSIPFLAFARDCIDTLGDLQIYFYGAIVFGLAGGILKKLLL